MATGIRGQTDANSANTKNPAGNTGAGELAGTSGYERVLTRHRVRASQLRVDAQLARHVLSAGWLAGTSG